MKTLLNSLFQLIYNLTEALRLLSNQEKELEETSDKWGIW